MTRSGRIGENPLLTERLWHLMWEVDRIEEIHMRALGMLDVLAWDVMNEPGNAAAVVNPRDFGHLQTLLRDTVAGIQAAGKRERFARRPCRW